MKEVKNAFLKSKMNKDLDDRLIPSGEYKNAVNTQVSKSDGSDVGALENVLGNIQLTDFSLNIPNLKSIGYLSNEFGNEVYVFLTDNSGPDYVTSAEGAGSNHFIYKYNPTSNIFVKLVEGAFLNFSKLNPIYGVNLIEDLLFWTDNRNQPRKINVSDATSAGYYSTEDQISVAKYNPYSCIELYQESVVAPGSYETTLKDVASKHLPNGGTALVNGSVTTSTQIPIDSLGFEFYPNKPTAGLSVNFIDAAGDMHPFTPAITVIDYTSPNLEVSSNITVSDDIELVFSPNPYYEPRYNGDPQFLEDKFARFSYRFKFDGGEYSIMAPFTQPCFIPKQDGYFLNESIDLGDQEQSFDSTVVSFMENKVNKIDLYIPLPMQADLLASSLHIQEIDILYKESDSLAVQVVESIPVNILAEGGNSLSHKFTYQSQKPYKTLPNKDIIRVYDKTPVKALAQEIISNRVVYGNYQDKHTPPSFLNYNISATPKLAFNVANDKPENTTSSVEFPNSSLKTNRNYQVGVILSDKFGRQSTTILSNSRDSVTIGDNKYVGSTLYSPYINEGIDKDAWFGNSLKVLFNDPIPESPNYTLKEPGVYNGDVTSANYNPLGWYSYKIVVKQTEQEYYNIYTAGALKGVPSDLTLSTSLNTSYITLINDNINKVPRDLSEVGPQDKSFRSSVRLYGRVENTATNNTQYYPGPTAFTSSSVESLFSLFDVTGSDIELSSSPYYTLFRGISDPFVAEIVTSQSVNKQFGVVNTAPQGGYEKIGTLAVFETAGVESRLDIFWETSTTGLITDLNDVIINSTGAGAGFSSFNTSGFNEGITTGTGTSSDNVLNDDFQLVDRLGVNIPTADIQSFTMVSVFNRMSTPQDVTSSYFELVEDPIGGKIWNIQVKQQYINDVFYGQSQGAREFDFTFQSVVNNVTTNYSTFAVLKNLPPVISRSGQTPAQNYTVSASINATSITTLDAVNGAWATNPNTGIIAYWEVASQVNSSGTAVNYFDVNYNTVGSVSEAEVTNEFPGSFFPADVYTIVLKVVDDGASEAEVTITVDYTVTPSIVKNGSYSLECDGETQYDYFDYVFLQVTDSTVTNQNGYYIWHPNGTGTAGGYDAWNDLTNGDTSGNVEIDYTNSNKIGDSCPTGSGWYFGTSDTEVFNRWKGCEVCQGSSAQDGRSDVTTASSYNFTIV